MKSSSYDNMDLLQSSLQTSPSIQPASSKKTKFGSILNDLSSFLTTATDTAVTVDGIINGNKNGSGGRNLTPQQQMALMQSQQAKAPSGSMRTALIVGGVAIVSGALMFSMLKKSNK